jgi:hypothetical protein
MTVDSKKLYFIPIIIYFLFIAVSCVATETNTPTVLAQTRDNTAGITPIIHRTGKRSSGCPARGCVFP